MKEPPLPSSARRAPSRTASRSSPTTRPGRSGSPSSAGSSAAGWAASRYVYRADNPERTKRYFREPPGRRRTHVHVRRAGSFSEQWALLFRDYRRGYTQAKGPFLWEIIRQADEWAQAQGWQPGPSDA